MNKLLLILATFLVISCDEDIKPDSDFTHGSNEVFVVNVKGHDYVIYDGFHKGGIVHAESCPCKDSQKLKHYE